MDKEKNKKASKKQNATKNKNTSNPKEKNKKEVTKKEIIKEEKVLEPIIEEEGFEEEIDFDEDLEEEEEYNEDLESAEEADFEILDGDYNEDLDEDYNNDLENETDDDSIEIKEIKIEQKPEKKEKTKKEKRKKEKIEKEEKKDKKEKTSKEKIEKIERIAKEKKKKTKTNKNSKLNNLMNLFDKYHIIIYSFLGGVLLASLVAFLIWPERIATLKNGEQPVVKVDKKTYTATDLYEEMKSYYSVSLLLDQIDNDLLTKLYPENDEMTEEVNSNAEYYFNMYKQYYGYTEEQFLEKNGFSSYDAFIEYLKLDYRRNKYLDEYVEDSLTDEEIKKYYDENVFGEINTQHVLVEVKSDSDGEDSKKLSDEDAKKLAEEIITKLNDGTSWEQIQKDYKDKITYEDLSYQSWDASLEESFMTALKEMEDNSYSEEPVKTSYGYHVIYRIDQKKKPSLKKTKKTIIENLVSDKKSKDSNLLYKSLISLREEKNITFSDTDMKSKYETYCNQYK